MTLKIIDALKTIWYYIRHPKQFFMWVAKEKLAGGSNPDFLHIALGYGFVMTFHFQRHLGVPVWLAFLTTLSIAGALEAFDHHFEFQPNSANWRDVIMYAIGGTLASVAIWI